MRVRALRVASGRPHVSRRTDLGRSRLQGFWANSGRQAWLPACLLGPFACLRFSHLSVSLLAPHSPHAASAGTGASRPVPPTSLSTTSVPAHTGLHGCTPPLPSQRIPETSPSPCGRQRWRTSASGVQPWGRDSSVSVLHRTWTSDVRDSGALQAAGGSQGARAASGPPAGEGSQESRCRAGPDQTCGPGRCCTPPPRQEAERVPLGRTAAQAMASEPVRSRPVGAQPRTTWAAPRPPRGQMAPQCAVTRGWSSSPESHQDTHQHSLPALAWPPACLPAAPAPGAPGGRQWGEGSAPGGTPTRAGPHSSWRLAPEARPNPSLPWRGRGLEGLSRGKGPGGRPPLLVAGQAGVAAASRSLGDDIGAAWPAEPGQAGRSVAWSLGLVAGGAPAPVPCPPRVAVTPRP